MAGTIVLHSEEWSVEILSRFWLQRQGWIDRHCLRWEDLFAKFVEERNFQIGLRQAYQHMWLDDASIGLVTINTQKGSSGTVCFILRCYLLHGFSASIGRGSAGHTVYWAKCLVSSTFHKEPMKLLDEILGWFPSAWVARSLVQMHNWGGISQLCETYDR